MANYTFLTTFVRIEHGSRYMEVTIDDEIRDVVKSVGEDELLEYIGKDAAVKYFGIEEA